MRSNNVCWVFQNSKNQAGTYEVEVGYYSPCGAWQCQIIVRDQEEAIRLVAKLNGDSSG